MRIVYIMYLCMRVYYIQEYVKDVRGSSFNPNNTNKAVKLSCIEPETTCEICVSLRVTEICHHLFLNTQFLVDVNNAMTSTIITTYL